MRVLWITNILFPEAEQLIKGYGDLHSSGGWLLGSANELCKRDNLVTDFRTKKKFKTLQCIVRDGGKEVKE